MKVIQVSENKTLKLTNVVSRQLQPQDMQNLGLIITQMENYIKSHGAMPVGPLVQYTTVGKNASGVNEPQIFLLRQANQLINHYDPQYRVESVRRVRNCLYSHYVGPSDKSNLAYSKLQVLAFEKDIELKDNTYTIYVKQDSDEMVCDVFMEIG